MGKMAYCNSGMFQYFFGLYLALPKGLVTPVKELIHPWDTNLVLETENGL